MSVRAPSHPVRLHRMSSQAAGRSGLGLRLTDVLGLTLNLLGVALILGRILERELFLDR